MKREPLSLSHKTVVNEALKGLIVELSEYSFANLYLFRKVHEYTLIFDTELYVEGKSYDGKRYLMPLSKKAWDDSVTLKRLAEGVDYLFPIPEAWVNEKKDIVSRVFLEAESDYIYDLEQLAHFSGRHLSKKRNLEKQFIEHYEPTIYPVTKDRLADALHVVEKWKKEAEQDHDAAETCEALQLLDELSLTAMIVYAGKEPVGVMVGEPLNARDFVVHFAKADTSYKGVYQYLYQQFFLTLVGKYERINMEQDLGDPNLKLTKHSYQPIAEVPKWRVCF